MNKPRIASQNFSLEVLFCQKLGNVMNCWHSFRNVQSSSDTCQKVLVCCVTRQCQLRLLRPHNIIQSVKSQCHSITIAKATHFVHDTIPNIYQHQRMEWLQSSTHKQIIQNVQNVYQCYLSRATQRLKYATVTNHSSSYNTSIHYMNARYI